MFSGPECGVISVPVLQMFLAFCQLTQQKLFDWIIHYVYVIAMYSFVCCSFLCWMQTAICDAAFPTFILCVKLWSFADGVVLPCAEQTCIYNYDIMKLYQSFGQGPIEMCLIVFPYPRVVFIVTVQWLFLYYISSLFLLCLLCITIVL